LGQSKAFCGLLTWTVGSLQWRAVTSCCNRRLQHQVVTFAHSHSHHSPCSTHNSPSPLYSCCIRSLGALSHTAPVTTQYGCASTQISNLLGFHKGGFRHRTPYYIKFVCPHRVRSLYTPLGSLSPPEDLSPLRTRGVSLHVSYRANNHVVRGKATPYNTAQL